MQGRRNRGGGARAPPSFQKCPFSGSKVPFTSLKNVVQIAFFAQWPLIYGCICFCILVCPEKFCYIRVKLSYARKIFFIFRKKYDISGKIFFIFGKKCEISRKFFGMSGKSFEMTPPPRRQHFRGKFLGALFHSKSAPQSLAPQLLDASYAPAKMQFISSFYLMNIVMSTGSIL